MKLQWYYRNLTGSAEKKKIVSRRGGYHGVTVASGSLTGLPPFHRAFDLPLQVVFHTDNPHYYLGHEEGETESQFVERIVNNLEELIISEGPETVSAFIAEPILGVAGVIVPPNGYYERVQSLSLIHI